MNEHRAFRVGGHTFAIDFPNGMLSEKELIPYAPFQTDSYYGEHSRIFYEEGSTVNYEEGFTVYCEGEKRCTNGAGCLFSLTLIDNKEEIVEEGFVSAHSESSVNTKSKSYVIANPEDENGKMTVFTQEDGGLAFYLFAVSGNVCGRLSISKDYRKAKAWIGGVDAERRYALDTALMLLYTFASSNHDTLLLHASTVGYNGKGYLFLGKSGTGKSTHSRLWLEHIEGSELLNDDNPILRIIDDEVYVYGSPWSGKTPCYRNRRIPTGGIVRLHQAPFNRITPLSGVKAYATLLPSCSGMKWDRDMSASIHSTIAKIMERVPVYSLECLPNREAALLAVKSLIASKSLICD